MALLHPPCAVQSRSDWVRVESPNLLVTSDGARSLGQAVASELELVREVAIEGASLFGDHTMRPVVVFALQDRDQVA